MDTEVFEMAKHLASYAAVYLVTGWLSYRLTGWVLKLLFGRIYRIKIIGDGEEVFRVRARSLDVAITKARKISIEGSDQCQS